MNNKEKYFLTKVSTKSGPGAPISPPGGMHGGKDYAGQAYGDSPYTDKKTYKTRDIVPKRGFGEKYLGMGVPSQQWWRDSQARTNLEMDRRSGIDKTRGEERLIQKPGDQIPPVEKLEAFPDSPAWTDHKGQQHPSVNRRADGPGPLPPVKTSMPPATTDSMTARVKQPNPIKERFTSRAMDSAAAQGAKL